MVVVKCNFTFCRSNHVKSLGWQLIHLFFFRLKFLQAKNKEKKTYPKFNVWGWLGWNLLLVKPRSYQNVIHFVLFVQNYVRNLMDFLKYSHNAAAYWMLFEKVNNVNTAVCTLYTVHKRIKIYMITIIWNNGSEVEVARCDIYLLLSHLICMRFTLHVSAASSSFFSIILYYMLAKK